MELINIRRDANKYSFMSSEIEALQSVVLFFNERIENKELTQDEKTQITLMNENIEELNDMIIEYNKLREERRMLTEIMLKTIELVKKQIIEITEEKENYEKFKKKFKKIKERNPKKSISEESKKKKYTVNLIY